MPFIMKPEPQTQQELLDRAYAIAGMISQELADEAEMDMPKRDLKRIWLDGHLWWAYGVNKMMDRWWTGRWCYSSNHQAPQPLFVWRH